MDKEVNEEINLTNLDGEIQTSTLKSEEIRKLFSLPPNEILVQDFSCIYKGTIDFEGRFYLFAKCICFYSKIYFFERKITIPFDTITRIEKVMHHCMYPSAIEVICGENKHLFTQFVVRAKAFKLMKDGLLKHGNSSIVISEGLESWEVEDVDAPQIPEEYSFVKESKFPMSVRDFFNSCFSDDASFFTGFSDKLSVIWEECGCSPWQYFGGSYGNFRYNSYIIINSSKVLRLCLFTCYAVYHCFSAMTNSSVLNLQKGQVLLRCKETQKFKLYKNSHLVVESLLLAEDSDDDMFGFQRKVRWDIKRESGESEDSCILKIYVNCNLDYTPKKGEIFANEDPGNQYAEAWIKKAHDKLKGEKPLRPEEQGNRVVRFYLSLANKGVLGIRKFIGIASDEDVNSEDSNSKATYVKAFGILALITLTARHIAGKGKETHKDSKPIPVITHTKNSKSKQQPSSLRSGITYEVMDEGEGKGISKNQQVTGLDDETFLDLTLTKMDVVQPTKPSPLGSKL